MDRKVERKRESQRTQRVHEFMKSLLPLHLRPSCPFSCHRWWYQTKTELLGDDNSTLYLSGAHQSFSGVGKVEEWGSEFTGDHLSYPGMSLEKDVQQREPREG